MFVLIGGGGFGAKFLRFGMRKFNDVGLGFGGGEEMMSVMSVWGLGPHEWDLEWEGEILMGFGVFVSNNIR